MAALSAIVLMLVKIRSGVLLEEGTSDALGLVTDPTILIALVHSRPLEYMASDSNAVSHSRAHIVLLIGCEKSVYMRTLPYNCTCKTLINLNTQKASLASSKCNSSFSRA